jgi:HSP20 family protein
VALRVLLPSGEARCHDHRSDPFEKELARLQREFEELLAAPPPGGRTQQVGSWEPAVDVLETERAFVVRADLPGVVKEDLASTVEPAALTLTGERRADGAEPRGAFLQLERPSGRFSRTLALPALVDGQRVEVRFVDGVLTLVLPKRG